MRCGLTCELLYITQQEHPQPKRSAFALDPGRDCKGRSSNCEHNKVSLSCTSHFNQLLSLSCFYLKAMLLSPQLGHLQLTDQPAAPSGQIVAKNSLVCTSLVQKALEQCLGIFAESLCIQLFDFSFLAKEICREGIGYILVNTENPRLCH